MSTDELYREYERHGKLSTTSRRTLQRLLASDDPEEAITAVGDLGLEEFADDVAGCLRSDDAMVRWNAICVLTTRLQLPEYCGLVLSHAAAREDELVRGAALVGVGIFMNFVPAEMQRNIGQTLIAVLSNDNELPEMRGAAYEGMLEALEVPVQERPSAAKVIDIANEVKREIVEKFVLLWQ